MSIHYEWVCEVVDAYGDREDLLFADSFADAMRYASHPLDAGYTYEIALWRKQYAQFDEGDLRETQYAYLETASGECWIGTGTITVAGARMPAEFDGAARIPKKFSDEVRKYIDSRNNLG
jgi:hypothetical protein